jgi:hypothetical protein
MWKPNRKTANRHDLSYPTRDARANDSICAELNRPESHPTVPHPLPSSSTRPPIPHISVRNPPSHPHPHPNINLGLHLNRVPDSAPTQDLNPSPFLDPNATAHASEDAGVAIAVDAGVVATSGPGACAGSGDGTTGEERQNAEKAGDVAEVAHTEPTRPQEQQKGIHSDREGERKMKRADIKIEARAQTGDTSCLVCCSEVADAVLLPCCHGGVCFSCAKKLGKPAPHCPFCRRVSLWQSHPSTVLLANRPARDGGQQHHRLLSHPIHPNSRPLSFPPLQHPSVPLIPHCYMPPPPPSTL